MMSTINTAFVSNKTAPVASVKAMDWADLSAMLGNVQTGDKDGPGWMPANIEPGPRTGERVKETTALVLDVEADTKKDQATGIKQVVGPEPPEPEAMAAEVALSGWACILHTSHNHSMEHPRYRLVFLLSRPLAHAEIKPLGLHVARLLGISDCIDAGCLEPARLYYLPRCHAERLADFQHADVDGVPLDVEALLSAALREADALTRATRQKRGAQSGSAIDAFNQAHDIGGILDAHGYIAKGCNRWLHPDSTTGMPGVRKLPKAVPERVYSSHGGDPLNNGHANDAFDCFRILKHGGDTTAATREAARVLGLSDARQGGNAGVHKQAERNAPAADSEGDEWPEPQPLSAKVEPEPYPVDALPDTIRAAVEEVAGFVKAPVPMVASSALAALSLAGQAHIDAKRAERLQGPAGLFLLTIADSGERKSTCDGFFVSVIRQYQEEQAEAMKPALKRHESDMDAWTAERDGLLSAIKEAGKKGKATDKLRADLAEIQNDKPEPPRVPRLLLGDETPENLAWSLARQWPSAGVVSSEAGLIFGAHGMGKDSIMRNLGLLNVLWDGGVHSVGRRTSESFTVKGARLTVALQIQEPTLRSFFDRSGGLARGTGFLARFLVAWPESTQGFRPFTEAPPNWPHLAAFHRRIAAMLANPVPMDDEGALSPALLMLAPEAKAAWVAFHDAIEGELASGGELYDVRDVASKSADNAARLGALFQIFEHGMGGAVGLDAFEGASRIAAWHLNESRRFFGELALPAELADAARLDSWLIEHCRTNRTHFVHTREAQRLGPGCVRDKERLTAALRELEELDRVRVAHEGRRKTIKVNPALLGVAL
ncbi:MAG: YfjI family protein [Pseudomonadota bacterium]|nr:YfjI family protein [Pseudomonadota bacterium]MDP1903957.1 YfjI family protein [Pseudomonadota bacterium]MDP2351597.1 YfjI family protein [Pseudomonadota bacterium]